MYAVKSRCPVIPRAGEADSHCEGLGFLDVQGLFEPIASLEAYESQDVGRFQVLCPRIHGIWGLQASRPKLVTLVDAVADRWSFAVVLSTAVIAAGRP